MDNPIYIPAADTDEAAPEGFIIDSPAKADWAVEQIKAERARRDMYIGVARERIEEYHRKIEVAEADCDRRTAYLLAQLDAYLDQAPAKRAKTQISLQLPAGKLVRKLESTDLARDNDALLAFVLTSAPQYVRVKSEPDWAELKKHLEIVGEAVVLTDTGEIVDGVTVVTKPAIFDIK